MVPKHLLRELEETIAKIDENRDKLYTSKKPKTPTLAQPQIQPLSIDREDLLEVEVKETGYKETLIQVLHASLNLPDYGEVKIQLKLRRNGTVETLKVLKTESQKNRKYLEAKLPLLKFPPFEGALADQNAQTFVLTFCNEI